MNKDDLNKEAYYYGLRLIARERALNELNEKIRLCGGAAEWDGTTLASVDAEAIEYAENIWPNYYGEHTHLGFVKPWSSIFYHAQLQHARFDIAVWQNVGDNRVLQGLATGSASKGRENLCLNWVERNFGPEYCRYGVLVPILSCFEHYAHLLDVQRVLIKNPVDPNVYRRYGYESFNIKGSPSGFLGKAMKNE